VSNSQGLLRAVFWPLDFDATVGDGASPWAISLGVRTPSPPSTSLGSTPASQHLSSSTSAGSSASTVSFVSSTPMKKAGGLLASLWSKPSTGTVHQVLGDETGTVWSDMIPLAAPVLTFTPPSPSTASNTTGTPTESTPHQWPVSPPIEMDMIVPATHPTHPMAVAAASSTPRTSWWRWQRLVVSVARVPISTIHTLLADLQNLSGAEASTSPTRVQDDTQGMVDSGAWLAPHVAAAAMGDPTLPASHGSAPHPPDVVVEQHADKDDVDAAPFTFAHHPVARMAPSAGPTDAATLDGSLLGHFFRNPYIS
jgi:hypothetical protein